MARPGRPPLKSKLVETLDASDLARERLGAILQSVEGEPIEELCQALGMKRAYFDRMRKATLQAAADSLEPKTTGPKPKVVDPRDARIAELEAEVRQVRLELQAARVREELAIALPSLGRKATT